MRNWFTSLNGAVTLSSLAFLTFLGRAFMDWRFEYALQDPEGSFAAVGAIAYMAIAGGWLWALLVAVRGSRRGLITTLVFVVLLDVAMALATYFIFCPPWTGCEGWPGAWPWNWSNLISGLLAVIAIVLHLRQHPAAERPVV
jgi:hypothetical protein